MKLEHLKGIGPAKLAKLHSLFLYTTKDLPTFYPQAYEDRTNFKEIGALKDGYAVLEAKICSPVRVIRRSRPLTTTRVTDGTGKLTLTWFHMPYLRNQLRYGKTYRFYGYYHSDKKAMIQPLYEELEENQLKGIIPLYRLPKGIYDKEFRSWMKISLEREVLEEVLPEDVVKELGFYSRDVRHHILHFPKDRGELGRALSEHRMERLLAYFYLTDTEEKEKVEGFAHENSSLSDAFIKKLPFELTSAQKRVWEEIRGDLMSDKPMNRLLQGDVGSGKTVLAALTMLQAIGSGRQAVLLAPTEVLARQHADKLAPVFESLGVNCGLLVGSMKAKQKERTKEGMRTGTLQALFGTHALLEADVSFSNLGVIVTDEQHRFGVRQRRTLYDKGNFPDMLLLSATPIPRTLALTYYKDLDFSELDERPPGRQKIDTFVVDETYEKRLFHFLRKILDEGNRAYVVCPAIDSEEDYTDIAELEERYSKVFPKEELVLLHGRMSGVEKEKAIQTFRSGRPKILISTTVIEVGVDVPDATLMVIYDADRFGLATLHQLRGRVGRGSTKSYCVLMGKRRRPQGIEKLKFLEETDDGFEIARKDLERRGQGDLYGLRQSGLEGDTLHFLTESPKRTQEATEIYERMRDSFLRMSDEKKEEMKKLWDFDSQVIMN